MTGMDPEPTDAVLASIALGLGRGAGVLLQVGVPKPVRIGRSQRWLLERFVERDFDGWPGPPVD